MKKKILSLLVLLALVCAALPACAQDEYFTYGDCDCVHVAVFFYRVQQRQGKNHKEYEARKSL